MGLSQSKTEQKQVMGRAGPGKDSVRAEPKPGAVQGKASSARPGQGRACRLEQQTVQVYVQFTTN